ncbi:SDR family oxidoreductase [Antrihabitans stalactiti]|uniref:3-dehydrosphinganine reductase n=1 Tax=Antrihabitans stalactiti TaxID=2584121 RepID=A0A848KD56_9NOCA|nr:SDR family oxidoreductase [Antrihabitans stalactiti]NMN96823.1 SDR family oxidoreductase [Antrihabitans stalactiti]
MRFTRKHVVITGGSSGIGLATASLLAANGADLSLIARRPAVLDHAAAALRRSGGTVRTAAADVSRQEEIQGAIADLVADGGPCDVLITSAGQARPGKFVDLADDVFRQMIEVDYFGTLYAVRAVAPQMIERGEGSITAISSMTGIIGTYGYTAYAPAKFAVRGLMEALRDELTPHGVHVGCVFPPDVDTPQLADENRFKPAETAAISGTLKPISADRMAASIVNGIEARKFTIFAGRGHAVIAGLGPAIAPLWRRYADHKVATAAEVRP